MASAALIKTNEKMDKSNLSIEKNSEEKRLQLETVDRAWERLRSNSGNTNKQKLGGVF
jgi:predicted transposase YdaD